MKIALCISGYFTNKTNSDLISTNAIYANIIDRVPQCDIFIHSFDVSQQDNILKKYPSVKKYIIEPQINFRTHLTPENIEYEKNAKFTYISIQYLSNLF